MELEIEDLHIQMEDVVKAKMSVSFHICRVELQTNIFQLFTQVGSLVLDVLFHFCVNNQ